jgi:hypothetical protein
MEVLCFPEATSVIARSANDEAIQSLFAAWIASLRSSAFNVEASLGGRADFARADLNGV